MNKTLTHDPSRLIPLCQNDIAIRQIKSKDFDNTPEARTLSENFASFEAILHEVGINKPAIQKYCRIVVGLAMGRTVEFECSDLTVGARYYYGDNWHELSEKDRIRCTNQGRRLTESLNNIAPGLIVRTVPKGKSACLRVELINLILRVSKLIELGYSASEAASLLEIPMPLRSSHEKTGRSKYSKLKMIRTLTEQIKAEDPELLENYKGGVLIHESLKCNSLDLYRRMGINSYKLKLVDDQLNIRAINLDPDFDKALAVSEQKQQSLILSHSAPNIIQLDDCDAAVVGRLSSYCFEVVQTSPGNFHCRLALPKGTRQKCANSVRDRLLKSLKPIGCCNGGGGKSFRLPGSTNFKPGRGNKVIRILAQEKFTSILELNLAGLIPYEHKAAPTNQATSEKIPDYNRIKTYNDHTDSARDFNFARQAASWGAPRKQIIAELSKASPAAARKGDTYINRTVDRAIANSRRWKSTAKPAVISLSPIRALTDE
jgi:hypothetical protein